MSLSSTHEHIRTKKMDGQGLNNQLIQLHYWYSKDPAMVVDKAPQQHYLFQGKQL